MIASGSGVVQTRRRRRVLWCARAAVLVVLVTAVAVPVGPVGASSHSGQASGPAVKVGMIALAGLDAETGVVMLLYLTLAHRRWKQEGRLRTQEDLREAIVEGAAHRIRPKLMTVLTMMIGLVPVLWSTGTGADVMKRIAAPMVGGVVTAAALALLIYPVIFTLWKWHREVKPALAQAKASQGN